MPRIPRGIYHIRYTPTIPPPIGGSYATSEGLDAQISAEALEPQLQQRWKIAPIGPDVEVYTITLADSIGGWGFKEEQPKHVPIVLVPDFDEWIFKDVDFKNGIFQIIAASPIIGVTKAVDLEGDFLVVNSFPIGSELPFWQITFADFEE